MTIGCIWDKHGKALLSMSITPNVIRVIVEGELVPATGLALGVPDDACVMGCISAVVRRITAVGRTLGVFAEYRRAPRDTAAV